MENKNINKFIRPVLFLIVTIAGTIGANSEILSAANDKLHQIENNLREMRSKERELNTNLQNLHEQELNLNPFCGPLSALRFYYWQKPSAEIDLKNIKACVEKWSELYEKINNNIQALMAAEAKLNKEWASLKMHTFPFIVSKFKAWRSYRSAKYEFQSARTELKKSLAYTRPKNWSTLHKVIYGARNLPAAAKYAAVLWLSNLCLN